MKKITLALPVLAASLLAVSACTKHDDAANNSAASDITLNDDSGLDGNVASDDAFANEVTGNAPDSDTLVNDATASGNATETTGNGL